MRPGAVDLAKKKGRTANPSKGIRITGDMLGNDSGAAEIVFVWNRGPHPVTLRNNNLTGAGTAYFVGPKPEEEHKKPK